MRVIREMEDQQTQNQQSIDFDFKSNEKVKEKVHDRREGRKIDPTRKSGTDIRRSKNSRANASQESLDYTLSSESEGDDKSDI